MKTKATRPAELPKNETPKKKIRPKIRPNEDLIRRLTPEGRATFERIRKLRETAGRVDMDMTQAIREIRENG